MTLNHSIPFSTASAGEALAALPAASGVLLLRGEEGSEPYLAKAADLRRRATRLLAPPDAQSRRLNLRELCRAIEFTRTGSEFEGSLLLLRTLRDIFPASYAKRLRLRPSPLVRIHWENAYPRAYLTRKLTRAAFETGKGKSAWFGPFATRAVAERTLNDILDLYLSRRCTFELAPDPAFPGCVYSEMKMCLAPCFQGCTDEAYFREVRRVQEFFESRGESLAAELAAQRESASELMEFERAASLHARIEKAHAAAHALEPVTQRLDRLDAAVVQRAPEAGTVRIFRFAAGQWLGPAEVAVKVKAEADKDNAKAPVESSDESDAESNADSNNEATPTADRLMAALEGLAPSAPPAPAVVSENLALLRRWYFRTHRAGEILFREPTAEKDGGWPKRRLANAALRVAVSP